MLVMERKPNLSVVPRYGTDLRVERTHIVFNDLAGDRLLPLRPNTGILAFLERMRRVRPTRSQAVRPATDASLAPDLWDLLGQG